MYDLVVIGGGINGTGIARDAAARGLKTFLCEKSDLAAETSSYSSKLIHGGLRYLEHYEFRLVRESLKERDVLLSIAPHLISPLEFIIPHSHNLRPRWMMRLGLHIYDFLGGRSKFLPRSKSICFTNNSLEDYHLKSIFKHGFTYYDCFVDDARLVIKNAQAAYESGAEISTRTTCKSIEEKEGFWEITLQQAKGIRKIASKSIVNAAGPWVNHIFSSAYAKNGQAIIPKNKVKHVRGSHIIVPRIHNMTQAFLLQNNDQRIIFVIPYEENFSLIGTTDQEESDISKTPQINQAEIDYLLTVVHKYFDIKITQKDIIHTYSGVRPLLDNDEKNLSKVTRDYEVVPSKTQAPLFSVYGGKLTSYRKLSKMVTDMLIPYFPHMKKCSTANHHLPGGYLDGYKDINLFISALQQQYPQVNISYLYHLAKRHGDCCHQILQNKDIEIMFGSCLSAAEVQYFFENEWACCPDDVLWRRTKACLHLTTQQTNEAKRYISQNFI